MPEFYKKKLPENFFPKFRGARVPLPPVSYAYASREGVVGNRSVGGLDESRG